MAFFDFNENLITDNTRIDAEHKKLIDIINKLFDAMKAGLAREIMAEILTELVDYTVYHFGTEEALMREHNYPEYITHKKLHDSLTNQVLALDAKQKAGNMIVSANILNFLKDWLFEHIQTIDKKLGKFLKDKGVE